MKTKTLLIAVLVVALVIMTVPGIYAAPSLMSFQGKLKDTAGNPINGNKVLTFRIYTTATGGSPLWSEQQTISVSQGGYTVILGTSNPINLAFDQNYWIGLEVGSDGELTPRYQLITVPYAFTAKRAESVAWSSITNRPSGLDDGDDVGSGGGTPASNVTALDGASAVGSSTNYAREDHKHAIGTGAITSTTIADGAIVDADISNTAAIAPGKLAQSGASSGQVLKWDGGVWAPSADNTGSGTLSDTTATLDGSGAGGTAVTYSRGDHKHSIGTGAINSTMILDGTIADADISSTAAIAFSKLSGVAASTHNHDTTYASIGHNHDTAYASIGHNHNTAYASIGHNHDTTYASIGHNHDTAYASITHNHDTTYVNEGQANSVTTGMITDSTIVNADISTTAAIVGSKLASDGSVMKSLVAGTNITVANNNNGSWTIDAASGAGDMLKSTYDGNNDGVVDNVNNIPAHNHDASNITTGIIGISRLPVGTGSTQVSAGNHNHDTAYAAIGHNHDTAYASITHNHDTAYASITHNHDTTYVNEGQANSVISAMITDGTIVNADISTSAAIDGSKLASNGTVVKSLITGTNITSVVNNGDGSWTINAAGGGGGTPSGTVATLDGTSSAGTSGDYSRGDHRHAIGTGAINSTMILDGTIADADISNTAGVVGSKLASDGSVMKSLIAGTNISSVVNNNNGSWTINASGGSGDMLKSTYDTNGNNIVDSVDSVPGHTHSTSDISSGTLSTSRYSAYDDLSTESKIGTGSTQVAAGDHTHSGYASSTHNHFAGSWSGNSSGAGLYVENTNTGGSTSALNGYTIYGYGVTGYSTYAAGVYGNSGGSGYGVSGSSSSGYGVYGTTNSSTAAGVWGNSSTNIGVRGTSSARAGVQGESTANGYYGVYGVFTSGSTGAGVYGLNNVNSTSAYGVFGQAQYGRGVFGTSTSGYGGYFTNDSTATNALYAKNSSGDGAIITTGNPGYYGLVVQSTSSSATNPGLKVFGTCSITGALSKGSGSFLIDHPLDPKNKVLRHSFVESPDMKNIYDGVVKLDSKGEAVVELPDYFEVLNVTYRYQLTPIGNYAPLFIKSKIEKGRFVIASNNGAKDSGLEVSWQVTGVRNDAYAQKNPIIVEEEKGTGTASTYKKGEYIHPEAFGVEPKTETAAK